MSRDAESAYNQARALALALIPEGAMAPLWKNYKTIMVDIPIQWPIFVEPYNSLKGCNNMHMETAERYVKGIFSTLQSILCPKCELDVSVLGQDVWDDLRGLIDPIEYGDPTADSNPFFFSYNM